MRSAVHCAALGLCLAGLVLGDSSRAKDVERSHAPASSKSESLNVILVVVDTLRSDHLSSYGYERRTSPNLDAFAAGALRFDDSRSQTACTASSMISLLTSRYPINVDHEPGHIGIPEGVPTFAEVMKKRGYTTLAVSASQIVRRTPSPNNRFGEFDRGFDEFHEGCASKDPALPTSHAACVNRAALKTIESARKPFFLYLHYMDPHTPYSPPSTFQRSFGKQFMPDAAVRAGQAFAVRNQALKQKRPVAPRDLQHLVDLYDDEIAYFDAMFGELLEGLRERGHLEQTIVVIASDHGEAFMERGYMGHCLTPLFDAMTETPLILRIPGIERTGAVAAQVQNVDIMPTVLDYLGIDFQDLGLHGRSLRPLIERDVPVNRHTFSVQGAEITASDREFALIRNLSRGEVGLYLRRADPNFEKDLSTLHPQRLLELTKILSEWFSSREVETEGGYLDRARDLDAQLRALGYLE